jgi:hypothetical protein
MNAKKPLPSLQIGDLTKITLPNRDKAITVYKIQVYARSKSDRYYTFCTPECYKAIRDYLDYRRRCGEKIQIELETELETDSDSDTGTNNKKDRSPLFRRQFNKENPFEINAPRPMGKQAFTVILDEALKRSGVKTSEAMQNSNLTIRNSLDYEDKMGLARLNNSIQSSQYNIARFDTD